MQLIRERKLCHSPRLFLHIQYHDLLPSNRNDTDEFVQVFLVNHITRSFTGTLCGTTNEY